MLQENSFHFKSEDVLFQMNALEAKIGTRGYFADTAKGLIEAIKKGTTNILDKIGLDDNGIPKELPFNYKIPSGCHVAYRYFIAKNDVEIIYKWRAFKDYKDFSLDTGLIVGRALTIRPKLYKHIEINTIIGAVTLNKKDKFSRVYLANGLTKTFDELFNNYELKLRDEWQPFGALSLVHREDC